MTEPTHYLLAEPRDGLQIFEVPVVPTVVVARQGLPMNQMGQFFDQSFGALMPALSRAGVAAIGPAVAMHHRQPTDSCDLEVGLPVDRPLPESVEDGDPVNSELPAGRIATVSYTGPYDGLGEAWGRLMGAVVAAGERPDLPFWEVYVTEPTPDTDPATLRTDLYVRLK